MKPANDTHWITRFNIHVTSNSNKVFGNGRHQLEVSVSVTPKSGEEITEEQLDSIRLVTLDDNGVYQELGNELHVSTERDKRFEYYADTGAAPRALLQANPRRRRFYVSSTRSGGSLDVVYAAITKDEETEYVSHTSKFNTSVTLETLTPLRMIRDDFEFSRENHSDQTVYTTHWDYDVYQLSLKRRGIKLVESIAHGPGSGQAYFQRIEEDEPGWFDDGLAPSNSRSYTHLGFEVSDDREISVPHAELSINRRPGSMIFVRVRTEGTGYLSGVRNTPSYWELIDQYGNAHSIEMTHESDGNLIDFVMTH